MTKLEYIDRRFNSLQKHIDVKVVPNYDSRSETLQIENFMSRYAFLKYKLTCVIFLALSRIFPGEFMELI